jgi:hypothetical protein
MKMSMDNTLFSRGSQRSDRPREGRGLSGQGKAELLSDEDFIEQVAKRQEQGKRQQPHTSRCPRSVDISRPMKTQKSSGIVIFSKGHEGIIA